MFTRWSAPGGIGTRLSKQTPLASWAARSSGKVPHQALAGFDCLMLSLHLSLGSSARDLVRSFSTCPPVSVFGMDMCPKQTEDNSFHYCRGQNPRLVTGSSISPGCSRVLPLNSDPSNWKYRLEVSARNRKGRRWTNNATRVHSQSWTVHLVATGTGLATSSRAK